MAKRELEIFILDMFKIHWRFPSSTTYKNVVQRSNNVVRCATFLLHCGKLRYVVVDSTLCCVAAARHNEAQHRTTWRQRRYSVAAARHNSTLTFTVELRGDSVDSTWRQRGTLPIFFISFSRTWRSETWHNGAAKTTTGARGTFLLRCGTL